MIRIEHLKKEYPNASPLRDVNAVIRDGDVISVIGPSGTGKSTLLRCINQLEKPTSGRVWLDDTEITDPKCDLKRLTDLAVVPREKPHTGAAAREQPRDSPVIER